MGDETKRSWWLIAKHEAHCLGSSRDSIEADVYASTHLSHTSTHRAGPRKQPSSPFFLSLCVLFVVVVGGGGVSGGGWVVGDGALPFPAARSCGDVYEPEWTSGTYCVMLIF